MRFVLRIGSRLALAVVAALGAVGCSEQHFCPDIAVRNGLTIDVGIPAQPATYRVHIVADGDALDLSFDATAQSSAPLCSGSCDVHGTTFEARDLPGREGQLAMLVNKLGEPTGPNTVMVQVYRGNILAAEDSFTPHYDITPAEGGCNDGQVTATVTLGVPGLPVAPVPGQPITASVSPAGRRDDGR